MKNGKDDKHKKKDIGDIWEDAKKCGMNHWKKHWKHGRCEDFPEFPHFIGFGCHKGWNIDKIIEMLQKQIEHIKELADKKIAWLQKRIDGLSGGGTVVEPVYEWRKVCDEKYVYDGWNVIAVYNLTETTDPATGTVTVSEALAKTLLWGEDLSGSLQGAGGVGGLLAVNLHSVDATTGTTVIKSYLPVYDGDGNIICYVDASNGSAVANYEYTPFGKLMVQSGALADSFVYRFSTKPLDCETGDYYYGY